MFDSNFFKFLPLSAIGLALTACGGSGSSGDSQARGRLSLSITDAPIHNAQSVTVNFSGAQVKPADGERLEFFFCKDPDNPDTDPPIVQQAECSDSEAHIESIDLLQQTGGASALLLDDVEVPAGRVNWVRLVLGDPAGEIVLPAGSFPLTVPSGSQTGLKLNRGFDVPEDGEADIYIDFDVRKSIVETHNTNPPSYKLKPTLRLVEDFGAITGEVDAALMNAQCLGGSIYVFAGADAEFDDIDRDNGDPESSTMVVADADSTTGFSYRADFLEPGEYRLAFVCAGGISNDGGMTFIEPADDPDEDDGLTFTAAAEIATVTDDTTVNIDF